MRASRNGRRSATERKSARSTGLRTPVETTPAAKPDVNMRPFFELVEEEEEAVVVLEEEESAACDDA